METEDQQSWFAQLFKGWTKFETGYILILLAIQVIAYAVVPDSVIGMMSGIMGVLCLVYGMKGRRITFVFGFIQCVAMAYIALKAHAYGAFAMDIVYVISQPIGWYLWGNDEAVNSFKKSTKQKLFIGAFIAWLIGWFILSGMGGQLPYFDSVNLVISLIAQTLYIFKYKENWSLWIFVNIANLLYWSILTYQAMTGKTDIGSIGVYLSQVALQSALLFNSVYANKVWNTYSEEEQN